MNERDLEPQPEVGEYRKQTPSALSEDEAALLSKPPVTLYANRLPESDQAFDVLEQAKVRFNVTSSPCLELPVATWGRLSFEGVTEIRELAGALRRFETVLVRETGENMPGFFEHPDTTLQEWMRKLHEQQLSAARDVMRQLHQPEGK